MKCRVCGNEARIVDVLKHKEKNVTTLYQAPFCAKKADTELFRCDKCTHMQIEWMNSDDYYDGYSLISDINEENGTGMYTESLLSYYRQKFSQLSQYAVSHDRIFDIGCGAGVLMDIEGEFFNETLGIEPSKVQFEIAKKQGKNVINGYFSEELHLDVGFSAFATTAVFEHIETIRESMSYAFSLLETGGVGLVEVPNGQKMYFEKSYYDVFPDHVNYFTPMSLCTLANETGFEVIGTSEEFNRNHLSLFVRKPFDAPVSMEKAVLHDGKSLLELVQGYRNISVWGVGAKARSFIQLLGKRSHELIHIWDVNALTWGKYLDSTDVPIGAPDKKEINESDLVLIFAAAYTEEIMRMLAVTYGYQGDVVRFDGNMRLVKGEHRRGK